MPPRLAHRKSRKGCRRCKERKVKCGEEHPSCSACLRHGVDCEYGDNPKSTSTQGTASSNLGDPSPAQPASEYGDPITPPSGLDSPYSINVANLTLPESSRHHLELYLIHRFKSSVTATFPSAQSPRLKDIYVWFAVDKAFDHRYLLDTIFAMTALYICMSQSSGETESEAITIPQAFRDIDFAQLHRVYLNQAVKQQRDALSSLGPSNADAVGLTTIMLSIMATALLPDLPISEEIEYSPPVQWLTLAGAISVVFQAAVPFLKEGAMLNYLRASKEPDFQNNDVLYNPANATPFLPIIEFQENDDPFPSQLESNSSTQEAYRSALALIGSIWSAIQINEPSHYICMRVVAFGPMVPKPYIQLLAQKRPRAMVILAHYMAFVKYIDSYWWFKGRAEREILGIKKALPKRWQWALRWPLAALESPQNVKLNPRTLQPGINEMVG